MWHLWCELCDVIARGVGQFPRSSSRVHEGTHMRLSVTQLDSLYRQNVRNPLNWEKQCRRAECGCA